MGAITIGILAKRLAKQHKLKASTVEALLKDAFDIIGDEIGKGGKASITDFGAFERKGGYISGHNFEDPSAPAQTVRRWRYTTRFRSFMALQAKLDAGNDGTTADGQTDEEAESEE